MLLLLLSLQILANHYQYFIKVLVMFEVLECSIYIMQSKSVNNLSPLSSKQSRKNNFIVLIPAFLVTFLAGSWLWREIQLNAAQKSVNDCIEHQNCADSISALEKLVKAKKSLKLFNLESAHLENAHLESANLKSANLENAHLESAHLENVHLENANLSASQMRGTHLENANLENANLSNAHLENANLYRANLQGAYISHDHLQGAHLDRANLEGTHFYQADFEHTYFHGANLSHTYFYRPNFDRANLYRANLDSAHLIEAQNLTFAQIKSACNWETAIYKGKWSSDRGKWVVDERANRQFIDRLKQDKDSEPKKTVDCSLWE